MDSPEFSVYCNKVIRYLNDATIVARMAHWNIRGSNSYEGHLLFGRIYADLAEPMDGLIEILRACGFSPDFDIFSGPGISLEFFDYPSLIDITTNYVMALQGAVGMFYSFCEGNSQDPRMVGVSNHLQGIAEIALNDLFLLQAAVGH
jgi:hypothetical protein